MISNLSSRTRNGDVVDGVIMVSTTLLTKFRV